jgi:hypothetical protein
MQIEIYLESAWWWSTRGWYKASICSSRCNAGRQRRWMREYDLRPNVPHTTCTRNSDSEGRSVSSQLVLRKNDVTGWSHLCQTAIV